MARPRRPFSEQHTIRLRHVPYMMDSSTEALGVRRMRRWEASLNWAYPTPNGYQDPLTVMVILDALMNIDPDLELRASNLVTWLNTRQGRITFDSVTVGKVLSDIKDAFEDALGPKMGLLEGGRDHNGNFYLIHHYEAVVKLAWGARDELLALTTTEMNVRARGGKTDFMGSPLLECSSLRGEFIA